MAIRLSHLHGGRSLVGVEGRPLRIGFVNNMPDTAFEDTYTQFSALIHEGSDASSVELSCFSIPTVPRDAAVLRRASVSYEAVDSLYRNPPDALVITGAEPRSRDMTAEPYWDELARLLRWAEAVVPSTLLSCLASHAAAVALDGIGRSALLAKQSGVYEQKVDRTHPLGRGLGASVAFPHSRCNEISGRALRARGYRLLVWSARTGWTVASRERAGRLLVLLQGHPEYAKTTLLKEYRRDVRRFLDGSSPTHPAIPQNYLDPAGEELLQAFRVDCESRTKPSGDDFPFLAAIGHIEARWEDASQRLFANWLADARWRTALIAS
jgi:homoserine O-succinyltransferase